MSVRPANLFGPAVGAALVLVGWATPAHAQVRGGVQVVQDLLSFSTTGQPMWGTPVGFSDGIDYFFDTGNKEGSFDGFLDTPLGKYGMAGTGGARAVFGLRASAEIAGGEIGLVYPMTLSIKAPEANSFRAGEELMLTTGWVPASGAAISSVAPSASFDVNSPFGVEATASAEVCFIGCFAVDGITVGFPENLRTSTDPKSVAEQILMYQMNAATRKLAVPVGLTDPVDLPYTIPEAEGNKFGMQGTFDLPHATLPCPPGTEHLCLQLVHEGDLLASANHTFANLTIDLDTWLILAIAKVKPKADNVTLGIEVPFDKFPFNAAPDGSEASIDVLDAKFSLQFRETQDFRFTPNPRVTLEFGDAVQWRVVDGAVQVASGSGKTVPFQVGQTLFVTFPNRRSPMDVASEYDVNGNRFENRTRFTLSGAASFKVLDYTVYIPEKVNESGNVWDETVPAFNESFAIPTVEQTFTGFTNGAGTPFLLDPEDPCLRVSTAMEPGLLNGLGPAGTLVQTIRVKNCGDVRVLTTQVMDALTVAFPALPGYTVNGVSSADLTTNPAWNGSGSTLAGSDVLDVGQTSFISIEFTAEPGNIYRTTVVASGESPIETPLVDNDAGSFAVYRMDFDADKLNNAGGPNALMPMRVFDTPDLDIHEIDPASLRIDGLRPNMWTYALRNDVGPETDLAAFFDRRALWDILQARRASALAGAVAARGGQAVLAEPELRQLAQALLSGAAVSDGVVARADRLGNANGRLDLGDLRAAARGGIPSDVALAAPSDGVAVTLPLTGKLFDGTPFVGEDAIIIP